ncbi:hypothetical protein MHU86_15286 [Fragilaria crotonensis]|nr:hypothetical protein MHU86_15286 [Fragilaria crotonensis]
MDGDQNQPLHGTILSQHDFALQQRAREKERKQRERETREALSRPATTPVNSSSRNVNVIIDDNEDDSIHRIMSPFDFAMKQRAKERERKDIERETKEALKTPQREIFYSHASPTTNESGIMSPNDFVAQQRALERERRDKERQTREALCRPA